MFKFENPPVTTNRPDAAAIAAVRKGRKLFMIKKTVLHAGTTAEIKDKPDELSHLWKIWDKLDHSGCWVIVLEGEVTAQGQKSWDDLKLSKADRKFLMPFTVYDTNSVSDAKALVVGVRQLLEAAFTLGALSALPDELEEDAAELDLEKASMGLE